MRAVKRINPIFLLIGLNVVLILFRDVLLPEQAVAWLSATVESSLLDLGVLGYAGVVLLYALCGFFFVPLLIPLNILGGALYGAWVGTGVALAGITLGCVASTLSARYVFTGMHRSLDGRPRLRRLIVRADRHRNLAIVMVRFAIVVPYLWQNIALAATSSSTLRIALLTAVSAIPGAAVYSFLGAGLVEAEDVRDIVVFVGLPLLLLLGLSGAMFLIKVRLGDSGAEP